MTRRDDPRQDAADGPAAFVFRPEDGDPNRMGALLDGRVRGKDRREASAEIAASDEPVEVFADAVVTLTTVRSTAAGWRIDATDTQLLLPDSNP